MTEQNNSRDEAIDRAKYGNFIIGIWLCPDCSFSCFPRHLYERNAQTPFKCPKCGAKLSYDEEE